MDGRWKLSHFIHTVRIVVVSIVGKGGNGRRWMDGGVFTCFTNLPRLQICIDGVFLLFCD